MSLPCQMLSGPLVSRKIRLESRKRGDFMLAIWENLNRTVYVQMLIWNHHLEEWGIVSSGEDWRRACQGGGEGSFGCWGKNICTAWPKKIRRRRLWSMKMRSFNMVPPPCVKQISRPFLWRSALYWRPSCFLERDSPLSLIPLFCPPSSLFSLLLFPQR